jgi:hypothetical protein
MKTDDRALFLEVVLGFAELKGKQLSAPGLELYWRSMQHWDLADFRVAAEQLVRTCEFMPTPKDFEDLLKAGRMTVTEQWTRVLDHAANLPVSGGYLQERPMGEPLLDAAVRACGGWRYIAGCDARDLQFVQQRFTEHFETLSDAETVREALPGLMHDSPKLLGERGTGLVAFGRTGRS